MITNIVYELWQKLTDAEKKDACRTFWDPRDCDWAPLRDFALEQISCATGKPLEVLKMRPNNELAEKTLPATPRPPTQGTPTSQGTVKAFRGSFQPLSNGDDLPAWSPRVMRIRVALDRGNKVLAQVFKVGTDIE